MYPVLENRTQCVKPCGNERVYIICRQTDNPRGHGEVWAGTFCILVAGIQKHPACIFTLAYILRRKGISYTTKKSIFILMLYDMYKLQEGPSIYGKDMPMLRRF